MIEKAVAVLIVASVALVGLLESPEHPAPLGVQAVSFK